MIKSAGSGLGSGMGSGFGSGTNLGEGVVPPPRSSGSRKLIASVRLIGSLSHLSKKTGSSHSGSGGSGPGSESRDSLKSNQKLSILSIGATVDEGGVDRGVDSDDANDSRPLGKVSFSDASNKLSNKLKQLEVGKFIGESTDLSLGERPDSKERAAAQPKKLFLDIDDFISMMRSDNQ